MTLEPLPVFAQLSDGGVSCHGTTVAHLGRAVLLTGPSGCGKSGTAAQMLCLGGQLVCDDLTILHGVADHLIASCPAAGQAAIELRGLGIVETPLAGPVPLAALLVIGPSAARLPEPEFARICGRDIRILRHPAQPDLAAKLMLWLAASEMTGPG